MKNAISLAIVVVALTAGGAMAQHGGQQHSLQGQQAAKACIDEFNAVVGEGRGFGLAFVADQNGYPGPMHVLELKDRLKLTADQEAKTSALYAAVRAELPKSTRLLEAERKLERLFAERTASESAVRAAAAEVEHARTEVRLVHLLAHVRTRDLLTEEQRRIYHEARWAR
ncbi:MAG TPA: Spy/CpxP family protein refolding chaperone [Methylomirabilota bacterium]|nr:Spy/CpxP family protein refolding chaperone [Methylomirabilota bacterium]